MKESGGYTKDAPVFSLKVKANTCRRTGSLAWPMN